MFATLTVSLQNIAKPAPFTRPLIPEGVREGWTSVSGHRMRYLAVGSGPPLVLIPGLFGFSFSWSENILPLSTVASVYAPDLLNTGYSDRTSESDGTLSNAARQILSFMDAVHLPVADIMGSSYGGAVAIAAAAMAPKRISRLILVSPAHPWSESDRLGANLFSTPLGGRLASALRFLPTAVNGYFVRKMYSDASRMLPGTVAGYAAPLKVPGTMDYLVRVARNWYSDFANLKLQLPRIADKPILLLWGADDRVVLPSTARELMVHLPNSDLVQIPCGHLPYEESPDEFNRAVLNFLTDSYKIR